MHVFMCVCAHVLKHMWKREFDIGGLHGLLSTLFFETDFLTEPGAHQVV